MQAWLETFQGLQQDGEVHESNLHQAVEACLSMRFTERERELFSPEVNYATLSREEFFTFLSGFLFKRQRWLHDVFDGLNHGQWIERHMVAEFFRKASVPFRGSALDESLSDAAAERESGPRDVFCFEDCLRAVDLYQSREGFRKADLEQFKLAFKVCERTVAGGVKATELRNALSWLGISMSLAECGKLFLSATERQAGTLNERQFLSLLRGAFERELRQVEKMINLSDHGHSISGPALKATLAGVGCYAAEPSILEALVDLGLGGRSVADAFEAVTCKRCTPFEQAAVLRNLELELDAEGVCELLMKIRSRESFTRQAWQELQEVFDSFLAEGQAELSVQGLGGALRWFGYSFPVDSLRLMMADVDLAGGLCTSLGFRPFVKLARQCMDDFQENAQEVFHAAAGHDAGATLVGQGCLDALEAALFGDQVGELSTEVVPAQGVKLPEFLLVVQGLKEDVARQRREYAGYCNQEVARFEAVFNDFADSEEGHVPARDTAAFLIEHFFPEYARALNWRPSLLKLIDEFDKDRSGTLDLMEFLHLMRRIQELEDQSRLGSEQRLLEELKLDGAQVYNTRSLFVEMLKATHGSLELAIHARCKLSSETVAGLIHLGVANRSRQELVVQALIADAMREASAGLLSVDASHSEAAGDEGSIDFPLFMRIMHKVERSGLLKSTREQR